MMVETEVFVLTGKNDAIPETYSKAIQGDDKAKWQIAMDKEMSLLSENNTWELANFNLCPHPWRNFQRN